MPSVAAATKLYLVPTFARTRDALDFNYPDIFLILGNDDPRQRSIVLAWSQNGGSDNPGHFSAITDHAYLRVKFCCRY
jgi:hypothetical protein